MKVLVTGANGFVGKHLCLALKNLSEGFDKTRPNLKIDGIFKYDIDSKKEDLEYYCQNADFVFNLAGVMRPENQDEHMKQNFGFASTLLDLLKKYNNICPVMLSSSIQASLIGRYNNEYGRSKKEGEELFFNYGKETGANVFVFRFTNLFGKWGKPNYNSVVSTFCYNISHDLPIQINDANTEMVLLYIDDLIKCLLDLLEGKCVKCDYDGIEPVIIDNGKYCFAGPMHNVKLGEIADLLYKFKEQPITLIVPEIKDNSFTKKLYSTYLSYLPKEKVSFALKSNANENGSFTEILKTVTGGQFSVNISKPNVTKGQHYHNTKWEFFIVIKGNALIQERNINTNELYEFNVSGDNLTAVHMLPGFTHNIINLSKEEDLITLMWANENFDKNNPDTYYENV